MVQRQGDNKRTPTGGRRRVFGWNPAKLAEAYDLETLNALRLAVEADPANRNPPGSFWIYRKPAQRKLDALAWAVTHRLKALRSGEVTS